MVDIKKINIPKVNVDTKKMMGAVDGLVDKIPPQVQDLLRKIAITLLIFFLLMGVYIGWSKGWESAKPQGMQLAQDARSMFITEIERDYNRKRKDVRMSDPEDLKYESNRKMQFDFVSERESVGVRREMIPEEESFLGKEYDFRNAKAIDTFTPPLYKESGDGLIPSPIEVEPISEKNVQNTNEADPNEMKLQRMLDRVSVLEKKLKEKNEEKNLKQGIVETKKDSNLIEPSLSKPRTLERIQRKSE